MTGIYIHIPFCASRCIYCDFFSTTRTELINKYVRTLCEEVNLRCRQGMIPDDMEVDTIYIGGGTPSLLSVWDIARMMDSIYYVCDVLPDAEITIECNPEDITFEYLDLLSSLPINRLSFGIQTFDDERLRFLGRRHTSQKAIEAIKLSQKAGFKNISIDLIFGFPGESLSDWENDISQALSLGIQHISAYSLMYEEGTYLTTLVREEKICPIDEDLSFSMYKSLTESLKSSGFEHYEISNYSLPGYRSRHNNRYWTGKPYIGLGAGAHSYDGNLRSRNVESLDEYIHSIESGVLPSETEYLSKDDVYNEYVMTRLRTCDGIDLEDMNKKFDKEHITYFNSLSEKHIKSGLLNESNGRIKLSEKAVFLSDGVISDLFKV